jgi:peroxiredoxin
MSKLSVVILLTVLLGSTAYMGYSFNRNQPEKEIKTAPNTLPDFRLRDIKGTEYSIHELAGNKPTLFVYFSSTCHLCQEELGTLSKRINEFKDYNLIFTTVQPVEEMVGFVASLGIAEKSNVHFLLDANMEVASFYNIRSVPSIYCYNSKKELMAEYSGITDLDLLKEKLSQGK